MPPLDLTADEVLTTTRAVRGRLDLDRPVERALIEECLRLATQAPTGRNRQRWDFVLVTDPAKRAALADLYRLGLTRPRQQVVRDGVDRGDPGRGRRITESAQYLFDHLHEVPVLLVPCIRVQGRHENASHVGQANTWGSVLPAVWQFMLAARSRGLGTAWTTPHLHYEREAAELLSIPYETVLQAALIPVAHTIGTDFRPGPRTDVDKIAHWDGWQAGGAREGLPAHSVSSAQLSSVGSSPAPRRSGRRERTRPRPWGGGRRRTPVLLPRR